jgi:replication factor C subunit 3/5
MEYKEEYLPWIEKYRPKKIKNIIGQEKNINCLKNMIRSGSFPHLIFYGISGTGKTSTILSICRELYGKNKTLMVMKLDASDDRGINSVRDEIKGFAEKMTINNKGIKLIILDEADSMTFDAQFALRRIIEKYSNSTRFCLICNYDNKIIPAIKSRCANFKFNPINEKFIEKKITDISEKEKLKIGKKSIQIISKLAKGDLRKSINLLQSISMKNKSISSKLCYEMAGLPYRKDVERILKYLIDDNISFEKAYLMFKKDICDSGYSLSIILNEFVDCMISSMDKIDPKKMPILLSEISDIEARVAKSTFGDIYLSAFVGIFKK